jgi:hypothetical protein
MQNSLLRLAVAMVLAVAAGLGNFLFMRMRTAPTKFVRFSKEVGLGEVIEESGMLSEIAITGDVSELRKSLFPWEERENIVGRTATRVFEKDSLALKQDFLGKGPEWRVLGPFKLVSVGERIRGSEQSGFSEGNGGQTITIAAEVKIEEGREVLSPQVQELLEVLYRSDEATNAIGKIVAVQLYPSDPKALASAGGIRSEVNATGTLPLGSNERGIIVPLKDVESIPEVLVRGVQVGFVVKL